MNKRPITFIAIDGHGGSGKSTLAKVLSESLDASVVHVDDFTGLDSTDDWYKDLIEKVIDPAAGGISHLSYPRAKWWPKHHPKPVRDQPVTPIIIIEGVGSSRRVLCPYLSLKIVVDTPIDIRTKRGLAKVKAMGNKSEEEANSLWDQWLDWDDQYFSEDDPKSKADIIIDGTKPYSGTLPTTIARLLRIKK